MSGGHESEGSEAVRGCIAGVSIGFYMGAEGDPPVRVPLRADEKHRPDYPASRGAKTVTLGTRLLGVVLGVAAGSALIVYYIVGYLMVTPPVVAATGKAPVAKLTLQTVASFGHKPHPDWVSYLAKNPEGKWVHSTVLRVPAHSLVKMTIYQFDTATGLRNPFWGRPEGIVGGEMTVDGKRLRELDPNLASHTFAIPDLGVTVPLKGVPDNAKNQCSVAPCTLAQAHTTITFAFRTGKRGKLRWQCFVPCAAGFILGFGGPMQTLGWMDGTLEVV
jgi:uncharacterized membrane protein YfcA